MNEINAILFGTNMYDEGYNQALEDVWKKAISKYDEFLDLGELREIIEQLKGRKNE